MPDSSFSFIDSAIFSKAFFPVNIRKKEKLIEKNLMEEYLPFLS